MIMTRFLIQNSLEKIRFFEKIFLLANISMEVILEMPFLSLSNTNIHFSNEKLIKRSYTTVEIVSIIN